MDTLAGRLAAVQERIAAAARAAGRRAEEITLVAVTKTWPVETLVEGYEAGLRHFGENRSDELAAKAPALSAALGPGAGVTWHFIGSLQSRQVREVVRHADCFHALDRLKIARRLSRFLEEEGRSLPVFLEVNVSGEATKAGFDCRSWESDGGQRAVLVGAVAEILTLPHLAVQGLMTMAPWEAPQAEIAAVIERTRALADWLAGEFPGPTWGLLSMGMTDDFELAIAAGATHVRIGRAIFGARRP